MFDFFKESEDVFDAGRFGACPIYGGGEVFSEGFGGGSVYGILLKGVAPVSANFGGFLVGGVGGGAIEPDDRNIYGFTLKGR